MKRSDFREWKWVKRIFLAKLDFEPRRREEFLLRSATPGSLSYLVRERLESDERAGSILSRPTLVATAEQTKSFAEGELLAGRFRIVRFLARGGMGEVYEALDTELQCQVAIKTISAEIADDESMLALFRREVRLARQVTHPNVCRNYDLFRHHAGVDHDVVFVSMELLHGETLAERLQRSGRMDEDEAYALLHQLAAGLAAAHRVGILHRDLKPENIMLEATDEGGQRAVIMDFGLAWTLGSEVVSQVAPGKRMVYGTPEYMSPEQMEVKPATAATDIYSLGLIAYRALVGELPFSRKGSLQAALQRMEETPTLPPESRLRLKWDLILSRCLDPYVEGRFRDAQELVDALTAMQDGQPAMPSPVVSVGRRFRAARGSALVFGIVVVVAAVAWMVWMRSARFHPSGSTRPRSVVLAAYVNASGEANLDEALNVALASQLQQSPSLNLMPKSRIEQALRYMGLPPGGRLTESIGRQVCVRERGDLLLQGTILPAAAGYVLELTATDCWTGKTVAQVSRNADTRALILRALDQLSEEMRSRIGESAEGIQRDDVPVQQATTSSLDALIAYSKGIQMSQKEGEFAALPYFQRAVDLDPNFALAHLMLSTVEWNRGDIEQARAEATRAYRLSNRVTRWEQFYIRSNYHAVVTGDLGKEMQANEEWSRVYPEDDQWPLQLAVDHSFLGQYGQVIRDLEVAIRNNPELAVAYGDLAVAYLNLGRPDEAKDALREAESRHLHEINMDWAEYWIAFYDRDEQQMQRVSAEAAKYPGLSVTMKLQAARTAMYHGQLQKSQRLTQDAVTQAEGPDRREFAALGRARESLWESELGGTAYAGHDLDAVLRSGTADTSKSVEIVVAMVEAMSGRERQSHEVTRRLQRQFPEDTLVNHYWLPVIGAYAAVHEGNAQRALELLPEAEPFATGIFDPVPCMDAVYARGEAHLALHDNAEAAADFREILVHRGVVLSCPTGALALLGLARALRGAGDATASKATYQDLLALWRDADDRLPVVRQARREYRYAENRGAAPMALSEVVGKRRTLGSSLQQRPKLVKPVS